MKDTLAKGCVLFLVRQGGWRNDKYLRATSPFSGRIWERIPLEERSLVFSRPVLEFLIWATAEKVNDTKVFWDAAPQSLTPADDLFFWLALDAIRTDPDLLSVLRKKEAFLRNPLCWISFPGDMVESDDIASKLCSIVRGTTRGLSGMSSDASRTSMDSIRANEGTDWRLEEDAAAGTHRVRCPPRVPGDRRAGEPHGLDAIYPPNERCTVHNRHVAGFWTGGLQGSGPPRLADRLDTQRSALAVPRQMETLEGWQHRARSVGYFDSDYQATQMWKSEWEAMNGDQIAARARAVVEMLEPLRGPD